MAEQFRRDPSVQITGASEGTKENPAIVRSPSEEATAEEARRARAQRRIDAGNEFSAQAKKQ